MWAPQRVEGPRLLIAIDTSLSMTRAELEEIARQLALLSERAHVTIAECDVEVTRVYPFAGALERVEGRGGTDLRPVFEGAFLAALGVDGVVYFTDGEGPYPEVPPAVPTLWVLTKPSEFRCPWGQRVRADRPREVRRSPALGGVPPRSLRSPIVGAEARTTTAECLKRAAGALFAGCSFATLTETTS